MPVRIARETMKTSQPSSKVSAMRRRKDLYEKIIAVVSQAQRPTAKNAPLLITSVDRVTILSTSCSVT
jgi:hypothetical protein